MKSKLKMLSIVAVSTVLLSISSYTAFAIKSDTPAKKERLQQLETEYSNKQRKIEAEIGSMPRNTKEDWEKIREVENNLKNIPMSQEADQLIRELSTPSPEQPK